MREPAGNRRHLSLRLVQRNFRLEPRNRFDEPYVVIDPFVLCKGNRRPQLSLSLIGQTQRSRHDTNDSEVFTAELQTLADNAGIGTEATLPETFANDHHLVASGVILFRQKVSTKDWPNSQRLEESRRNASRKESLRITIAREVVRNCAIRGDVREHRVLALPFEDICRRDLRIRLFRRIRFAQRHQLLRLRIIKRTQQHAIHHAEDRSVRTDAKRKRDHCNRSEPRPSSQSPQRIPNIFNHRCYSPQNAQKAQDISAVVLFVPFCG